MNPDEFYKTLTSLPEKDQLDVINAMSTEDAKLLSDYHDSQQSPNVAQLPEVAVYGNQSDPLDQVSSILSQKSSGGISLEGLTPDQQIQVVERDSPLIKPIQDGAIRDTLGGGAAANMVENAVQGVTNAARTATGTLKAAGNFVSGNPAEQMADTFRFKNQLDQEGSTGVNRMGRLVSHHLGQLAASTARSPLAPVPIVPGFKAAKGAWGATKAIAGNFAVDFGMISMIEGTAQALEALGDQTVGDVNKRVTDTLGTAAIGAGFGAAARTVGALAKGGLSKLAVSYDKSENAKKIVAGLADDVNKIKEKLNSFTTGFNRTNLYLAEKKANVYRNTLEETQRVELDTKNKLSEADTNVDKAKQKLNAFTARFNRTKLNLEQKKMKIDNQVLVETQKLKSQAEFNARNELATVYKSKEDVNAKLNNSTNRLASLSNDLVNTMSSAEEVVRGTIDKSYSTILDGDAGQKALNISGYIDDIANQLSFAGKEDTEISTAFIGSMKKILPGISFNKIDDAAKTLMDTGGSLTVKQAHTLRVDMNDIIRKKINDPKLYDQMAALKLVSNQIGEDISSVAGVEYKATNALYSQYIDSSTFIDKYVGPLKTAVRPMPGQDPLKKPVVRLGVDDKLNKFSEVAPPDIEGFFKGNGTDTSPLVKQLELQNTAAQSFLKQVDLFDAVGKTAEADNARSTISAYAKEMVNLKGLNVLIKETDKMIGEYTDKNLAALMRNSPEMQQLLNAKEADLKAISDQIFNLKSDKLLLQEGVTAAQNATKKVIDDAKDMKSVIAAQKANELNQIADQGFSLDREKLTLEEGVKEAQNFAKKEIDTLKSTGQMSESDVMNLNSTLTQIGWSSGSHPLKMAMINIAAWNSLLHYAPRLASNAMKGITKVENALLAKQNANDIARVARKGIENADNFVRSKKLTVSQKSAWTWALETIGYERNDKYEKDRKQKEALQNLDL